LADAPAGVPTKSLEQCTVRRPTSLGNEIAHPSALAGQLAISPEFDQPSPVHRGMITQKERRVLPISFVPVPLCDIEDSVEIRVAPHLSQREQRVTAVVRIPVPQEFCEPCAA